MNCSRPSTAPVLSRRAQRSPRALHSGYLAAARENLAPRLSRRALRLSRASQVISRPPQVISSRQVISRGLRISRALQAISSRLKLSRAARLSRAGPGCLEHLRSSRGRLELSREARLSRAGSGYLERSGYLEGSVEITRASRWLGPLRLTRSAQDDSVRYESSHVARHCKGSLKRSEWGRERRRDPGPVKSKIQNGIPYSVRRRNLSEEGCSDTYKNRRTTG